MKRSHCARNRFGLPALVGLIVGSGVTWGQGPAQPAAQPAYGPQAGPPQAVQPGPPVVPQYPTLERRDPQPPMPRGPIMGPPAPVYPSAPQSPFTLSPQQAAELDNVLNDWERRNKEVKSFDCELFRWTYDGVFNSEGKQPEPDRGILKYTPRTRACSASTATGRSNGFATARQSSSTSTASIRSR